ncbi:uncharacterized protein CDAR_438311 [Caerostris darwini]|uniref:Gustatory receptor n=1 Tax=Caerostris darwini TaxID=1538125 RepID=A0AAV4X4M6_9ARAC|nr:uncharacterized protein CDAR_438311 [Caerostris darwini]
MFPLGMWYNTYKKRYIIRNLIEHYNTLGVLRRNIWRHRSIVINIVLLYTISVPLLSAVICAKSAGNDTIIRGFYTFEIQHEENFINISIRSILIASVFSSIFIFTCVIALMCGILYYNMSDLFYLFCKDLKSLQDSVLSPRRLRKRVLDQSVLFQVSHRLEEATSVNSGLFLCSQIVPMYVSLATFFLFGANELTTAILWANAPTALLAPFYVIGITLCASRISSQIKNCNVCLQILHDRLIYDTLVKGETLQLVKAMMNRRFTSMSACSVVNFTPNIILSIFGSLLTYGLLILNFKQSY